MNEKLKEIVEHAAKIFEDGQISLKDIPEGIQLLLDIVNLFKSNKNEEKTAE